MAIVLNCSKSGSTRTLAEAAFVMRRANDNLSDHVVTLLDLKKRTVVKLTCLQSERGGQDFLIHHNRYGQVVNIPAWFVANLRAHLPSVEFFHSETAILSKWRLRLSLSDLVMLRLMDD